jgi:hypothetical protein
VVRLIAALRLSAEQVPVREERGRRELCHLRNSRAAVSHLALKSRSVLSSFHVASRKTLPRLRGPDAAG